MPDDGVIGSGEFVATLITGTTVISGRTFANKEVQYSEINGLAIFEGDIVLGTVEQTQNKYLRYVVSRTSLLDSERLQTDPDVKQAISTLQRAAEEFQALGIAVNDKQLLWPGNLVTFEIHPALPFPERVTQAIAHWEAHTKFRFKQHQHETDFVVFQPGADCNSPVGRVGGQQIVMLDSNCTMGGVIHEIGHTIGLWHEHTRSDRDRFIHIDFANITPGAEKNFTQHISDGVDLGNYDYGSIMHYPAGAFAKDTSKPTIIAPGGVIIGQRSDLSAGDIAAANTIASFSQ